MKSVKDQAIKVLQAAESGDDIFRGLLALGFERSYRPTDVFSKVWEHPSIRNQDTRGARIMGAIFCTLYEWPTYGDLAFVIGRMGNTTKLIYRAPREK